MNINLIYKAAKDFRDAIELVSDSLGQSFESFPLGACGDAALLLGTYLIEQGLGEFQYMLGEYGSVADNTWSSHAWLQHDNLIVDITADQFPEISEPVIVSLNSPWHAAFDGKALNLGDYRVYDSHTLAKLSSMYAKITSNIKPQPIK